MAMKELLGGKPLGRRIKTLVSRRPTVDEDLVSSLEEILVSADAGVKTSSDIVDSLRKKEPGEDVGMYLAGEMLNLFSNRARDLDPGVYAGPAVVLVVGASPMGHASLFIRTLITISLC